MFIINERFKITNKSWLYFFHLLIVTLTALAIPGCKKFVDIPGPGTSTNVENVYTNDATAAAVLTGVYSVLSQPSLQSGSLPGISYYAGLSADELTLYDVDAYTELTYYRNELASITAGGGELWRSTYPIVFYLNAALEGLQTSNSLSDSVKRQLIGEALFTRSLCFFYLCNLYGEIPLPLSTDYKVNGSLRRLPISEVYAQIITDLQKAQSFLDEAYKEADAITSTPNTFRLRPNKAAATALLARAYLYIKEYSKAAEEATKVISQTNVYNIEAITNVFTNTSREAIWQLQPVNQGWNTEDARMFLLPSSGPGNGFPVYLSESLYDNFEAADQRRNNWIGEVTVTGGTYHYPAKYTSATLDAPVTEYTTVLRLGELLLIRAEARAQLADFSGASEDISVIRLRAGLNAVEITDQEQLMSLIQHERQLELFTEWGHRWLDLKRTDAVDSVMTVAAVAKGGSWTSYAKLYPLPLSDLQANPNLTQNDGY